MVDHRDSVVARSKWELPLPDQKLSGGGEIIFRRTAGGATTAVRQCLNIQLSAKKSDNPSDKAEHVMKRAWVACDIKVAKWPCRAPLQFLTSHNTPGKSPSSQHSRHSDDRTALL